MYPANLTSDPRVPYYVLHAKTRKRQSWARLFATVRSSSLVAIIRACMRLPPKVFFPDVWHWTERRWSSVSMGTTQCYSFPRRWFFWGSSQRYISLVLPSKAHNFLLADPTHQFLVRGHLMSNRGTPSLYCTPPTFTFALVFWWTPYDCPRTSYHNNPRPIWSQ